MCSVRSTTLVCRGWTSRLGRALSAATSGGDKLRARGVEVAHVACDARGRLNLAVLLTELANRRITRLLVEGGATVHSAFLDLGLADRLEIFTAQITLGSAGHGAIGKLAALTRRDGSRFNQVSQRKLGPDLLESFVAKA